MVLAAFDGFLVHLPALILARSKSDLLHAILSLALFPVSFTLSSVELQFSLVSRTKDSVLISVLGFHMDMML